MMQAVVDRFEGKKAVLYIGEEETKVIFPGEYLPAGTKEGDCLRIEIFVDEKATIASREESQALLNKLKEQNK